MAEESNNTPDNTSNNKNQLSKDIADGKEIQWSDYESAIDAQVLKKFQDIENITKAFTQAIISDDAPNVQTHQNTGKKIFDWAHLHVIEKIGQGSFGEVFRAYDPILNRDVALKLRHAELHSAAGSRAFLEEARRLAQIRHRNVIAVHGAAFEQGQVGIWTDLLDGQNLKSYFTEHGVIEIDVAYQLVSDIARALSAVHEANMVHGDVKSSNIMRQSNGTFVLMDFGSGSHCEGKDSITAQMGTPLLMAPELFEGVDGAFSAASDQYAFGAMLYHMLTGHYPLTATTTLELQQLHKENTIKPVQSLRPNLPKALSDMINALLSTDTKKRPTAKSVIKTLNWIENTPKRRKKILAISAVIASLSVGIIISSWGYINANRAKQQAVIANQESQAVSGFLADILKSARPNISGKNTPVIEVLQSASKKLETALIDQPIARSEVLHHIGKSYLQMTAPKQAVELLQQAHQLRLKHLGAEHVDTLATQAVLGETLSRLSRFEEAKSLLFIDNQEAIDKLTKNNNVRLSFISAISIYYNITGEQALSEQYAKKALLLIDKDKEPLQYHERNLKMTIEFNNQQRFKESEPLVRDSLLWAEKNAPRSALTLGLRQQLSSLLGQTGRFEESESLVRHNIAVAKEWLGDKDPYLIQSLTLLSNILGAQKRLDEALAANTEALNLSRAVNGDSDWYTIRLMGNQANRLKSLNQAKAAESIYLETIELAEKALSPKHQFSYLPRKNLTELYLEQQQYDAGIAMAEITLPIIKEARGENNPWFLELRYLYGSLLKGTGRTTEAHQELNETLAITQEILGDEHALTVAIRTALDQ